MKFLKQTLLLLLIVIILLSSSACRQRITESPPEMDHETLQETDNKPEETATPQPDSSPTPPIEEMPEETPPPQETEQVEIEINMSEDPSIDIPKETGTPGTASDTTNTETPKAGTEGEQTVSVPEAADVEGETNLSDTGDGTLGTIIDNYTQLLNRGMGSLYECERANIYFERSADYLTVNRSSPEHPIITDSGGYNVAEKLGSNSLTVDSGWILRKNPTTIIKSVDSNILGKSVSDSASAYAEAEKILSRPGLEGASAIINRQVILISEELFGSNDGKFLAKLYISYAMYPSLFKDIDLNSIAKEIRDSGGKDFTKGIYLYKP